MEKIKQPNIDWEIVIALIVFCVIAVIGGTMITMNQSITILDRIEQLEAQIDKLERTNTTNQ